MAVGSTPPYSCSAASSSKSKASGSSNPPPLTLFIGIVMLVGVTTPLLLSAAGTTTLVLALQFLFLSQRLLLLASACHLVDQKLGLIANPSTSLVSLHLGWVLSCNTLRCCPCLPVGSWHLAASPLRIRCVHFPHLVHHSKGVPRTLLLEFPWGCTIISLCPLLTILSKLLTKLPGSQDAPAY